MKDNSASVSEDEPLKNKFGELKISLTKHSNDNGLNSQFSQISKSKFISSKLKIHVWSINEPLLELLCENLIKYNLNQCVNYIGIILESAKSLKFEDLKKIGQLFANDKLKALHIKGMSNDESKDTELVKSLFTGAEFSSIEISN